MKDRTSIIHISNCSTCWYENKNYCKKCIDCQNGSNYTFPYGYWKKFYDKNLAKL